MLCFYVGYILSSLLFFAAAGISRGTTATRCEADRMLLQVGVAKAKVVTDLGDVAPCSRGNSSSALLLTMYNTEDRKNMTQDIVAYYAKQFPKEQLFLVDSAGTGVPLAYVNESNQVLFRQDVACHGYVGSTQLEICSLREAFRRHHFQGSSYVFKLTAKYKLPQLQQTIANLADGYDFIFQNKNEAKICFQNTELLGGRVDAFEGFLDWLLGRSETAPLENLLFAYVEASPTLQVCRLPSMVNIAPYKRGVGDHLVTVLKQGKSQANHRVLK